MDSQPPLTSATSAASSSLSPVLVSAAHRSCSKCSRRMSSYKYDKHALCLHCRDVLCSVDLRCRECSSRRMSSYKYDKHTLCLHCRDVLYSVDLRCRECSSWSTDMMQDYLKHRKSLVSKGKEKSSVATPTSSAPSVPPSATPTSVSVAPPTPTLTSVASDECIKEYVHSVLASFLSQPATQLNLGSNPFISPTMAEVPNVSHRGSAGGSDAESLLRGRQVAPSGMVPWPQEEDGISSPIMSVFVDSGRFVSVSGPHIPSVGQLSALLSWDNDQSRVHGASSYGIDNVSVNVSDVAFLPSASTSFDPSSLLFPSSDLGFASFPFSRIRRNLSIHIARFSASESL